jgi:hypothetical protein
MCGRYYRKGDKQKIAEAFHATKVGDFPTTAVGLQRCPHRVLERRTTASWQWTRNDEPYANIRIRPEPDRVVLSYRHPSGGNDWQSKE